MDHTHTQARSPRVFWSGRGGGGSESPTSSFHSLHKISHPTPTRDTPNQQISVIRIYRSYSHSSLEVINFWVRSGRIVVEFIFLFKRFMFWSYLSDVILRTPVPPLMTPSKGPGGNSSKEGTLSDNNDWYFVEIQLEQIRATACYSAYAIARPSVRLSVRRVDHRKTVEVRITKFSPYDSPISLVFAG